jgi:shikimate dehydrogenase
MCAFMTIFNLALLGDPVEHSLSPEIHSAFFRKAKLKGAYSCIQTSPGELATNIERLQELGFRGVNLTIPHKHAGLKLAHSASTEAELIGSANTLVFDKDKKIFAENTDWKGFLYSLPNRIREQSEQALVLGAGGSAKAVVAALLKTNVKSISLMVRGTESSRQSAYDLRDSILSSGKAIECRIEDLNQPKTKQKFDLVINTVPIGMHGMEEGKSPLKETFFDSIQNKKCFFYDLIYNPAQTELMRLAREREFEAQNGYAMLELQAAHSFALWTGVGLNTLLKS